MKRALAVLLVLQGVANAQPERREEEETQDAPQKLDEISK